MALEPQCSITTGTLSTCCSATPTPTTLLLLPQMFPRFHKGGRALHLSSVPASPSLIAPGIRSLPSSNPPSTMAAILPPVAIIASIEELLTCTLIGGLLSTLVYGITVLQTYIYYKNYKKDPIATKVLVGVLFVLDSTTTALVFYGLYDYLVGHFMAPVENYFVINPTFVWEHGLAVVIGALVQVFFACRLWYYSRNRYLIGAILGSALAGLGPGLALTIYTGQHARLDIIGSVTIRILAGFANGFSVISDILIAAGLCYYLSTGRTGFKSTDTMIDRLMAYAIQRGALTTLFQAGHMIMNLSFPTRSLYLPFSLMAGKSYCNTLLATLNVRKSVRNKAQQDAYLEPGSHILASIPRSTDMHYQSPGQTGLGSVRASLLYSPCGELSILTIAPAHQQRAGLCALFQQVSCLDNHHRPRFRPEAG
ncbi:hypothetical protein C8Q76DRAFT_112414 [Earliella scabrosa]|nr:hypothetical protein C8Q76DRAFT_112414 [Earliella scabrosa]